MLTFVYNRQKESVKDLILDDLKNLHKYEKLSEYIKICSDFVNSHDLDSMKAEHYEIDGSNLYVNIDEYTTKEKTESLPELHRKYADIQMVIRGKEFIGYSDKTICQTEIEYNEEKDIEFLKGDCEYFCAEKGRFFIFFPEEVHHPCIMNGKKEQVKKAVFKIKVN